MHSSDGVPNRTLEEKERAEFVKTDYVSSRKKISSQNAAGGHIRFYDETKPETDLETNFESDLGAGVESDLEICGRGAPENNILTLLKSILSMSPTAKAMLDEAMAMGWSIHLDECEESEYVICLEDREILLNDHGYQSKALAQSPYFQKALLHHLIKALRDVWHEKRQGGVENFYSLEGTLFLERIRAADLDVICILVAWELRSEGQDKFWRHMIGSDIGDLAVAYHEAREYDPSDLTGKKALRFIFEKWFESAERVNTCDHACLNYIDGLMDQNAGDAPVLGRHYPGAGAVELVSCLPDKTAYLKGMGAHMIKNPAFEGLNDPINQTHFMHILHDSQAVYAGNVAFRDKDLAAKMFPVG